MAQFYQDKIMRKAAVSSGIFTTLFELPQNKEARKNIQITEVP